MLVEFIMQCCLNLHRCMIELLHLLMCEIIEMPAFTGRKMREDRTDLQPFLCFEHLYQCRDLLRKKAEAVHAAVNFQVNGIIGNTSSFCFFDKSLKDTEIVELRLQIVIIEIFKTVYLRIEHDQGEGDPFISQQESLFRHSHGQIIAPMIL